jgi:hypothetical protein
MLERLGRGQHGLGVPRRAHPPRQFLGGSARRLEVAGNLARPRRVGPLTEQLADRSVQLDAFADE